MSETQTARGASDSRIEEAVQYIDDEFQRIQKQIRTRRNSIEKQFEARRKQAEKRTRKELKRIQGEFKKNPIVKRADAVRKDVAKQVEARVDAVLGAMQIASRSDIRQINRKLTALNRRVKAIEDGADREQIKRSLASIERRVKTIEDSRRTNGTSPAI